MRKNLSEKVTLSILAGAMLFSVDCLSLNNICYAANASDDVHIQTEIKDNDDFNGLTVSKNAENSETAENNTITVSGGAAYDVYAAVTGGGDAKKNIATMTNGEVAYLGGAATDYGDGDANGAVIENKVIMSGGTVKEVVGGEAFGTGIVQGNGVEMSGGTAQNLYGGTTYISKAEGNYVKVSGNAVVTGSGDDGYEENGVKITNKGVYGAMAVTPENNDKKLGDLVNNSVVISGNAKVSNVYGAYSEGDSNVTGNAVTISDNAEIGSGSGQVLGASTGSGMATGNYVTINGGEAGDVYAAVTSGGDAKIMSLL